MLVCVCDCRRKTSSTMYFPEEEADLDFQTPSRQNDGPPIRPSTLSNVPPSARLFPTSSALLSQSEKRGSIRRSPTEMRVSGREIREMLGQVSPTNGLMRGPEDTSDDFVVRRAPPSEYRQIYQARFASRFLPSSFPLPFRFLLSLITACCVESSGRNAERGSRPLAPGSAFSSLCRPTWRSSPCSW